MAEIDRLLEHAGFIERLARSLVADPTLAEELVQETWVAALESPPEGRAASLAWLARTLRNLSVSHWRRESARRRRERSVARPEAEGDAVEGPLDRIEEAREVLAAVARLDEPHRLCVLRRYYDDWSPTEIARREGIPLETVRTRLRRARARLRDDLDARGGPNRARRALLLLAGAPAMLGGSRDAVAASLPGAAGTATVTAGGIGGGIVAAKGLVLVGAAALAISAILWIRSEDPPSTTGSIATQGRAPTAPDPVPVVAGTAGDASPIATSRIDPVRGALTGTVRSAAGGGPVAGARVAWIEPSGARWIAETITGPDGRFRFEAEAGSRVDLLRVVHPEFAAAEITPRSAIGVTGVDCGVILLDSGVEVIGRVVDLRSGRGVAGVEVWSVGGARYPRPSEWTPVAIADAAGGFALDRRLPRGSSQALVVAGSDGYGHARFQVPEEAERLEVQIPVHDAGRLIVRVIDDRGAPVADRCIAVQPLFAPHGYDGSWNTAPDVPCRSDDLPRSTENGAFEEIELSSLTDSRGEVEFSSLPLELPEPGARPSARYRVWLIDESQPIGQWAVVSADNGEIVFRLDAPPELSVSGRVSDDAGLPIEGAELELAGMRTSSDAAGEYAFPPHSFERGAEYPRVTASAQGHRDGGSSFVPGRATTFELDIVLRRALSARGVVVDPSGRPVEGVRFELEKDGDTIEAISAEDGSFEVDDIDRGRWNVRILSEAWALAEPAAVRGGDSRARCIVRPATGSTRLIVRVTDHETGEPVSVERASLFAAAESRGRSPTRRHGVLEADGLYPGEWSLGIHVPDLGRAERVFTVAEGEELIELDVELGPPASLELRIDTGSLDPGRIPGRIFLLFDDQECYWTDEHGIRMPGVTNNCAIFDPRTTPAVHIVGVTPDRPFRIGSPGGWVEESVTLRPGERRTLVLALRSPGKVLIAASPDSSTEEWRFFTRRDAGQAWVERRLERRDGALPGPDELWLPAGEWQWLLRRHHAAGNDREIERTGTLEVPAGGEVHLELP